MERLIRRRYTFRGKLLKLREDTVQLVSGKTAVREVVEHPGAVAVIAVTKADELILVRQWRQAAGQTLLEVPAGTLKRGETPLKTAARELEEETGYRAGKLKKIISGYVSPGYSSELIHFVLATELIKTKPAPEEDENIAVVKTPLKKAIKLVKDNKIKDNKTIIGVLLAA